MDAQALEVSGVRDVLVRPLVGLALVLLVGLGACVKEEEAKPGSAVVRQLADQVISNFSITETTRGRKEWVMEAQRAYLYEKRNVLEAQNVKVTFFDDKGAVQSVLTAESGKLNRGTDDMEAAGNVVVTGSGGTQLKTESLTWTNATHKIASEDSVTIIRRKDILTGWGFEGDPDLGKFAIHRNMRATIRPDESAPKGVGG
jgi:LPS export ABC transporter protein LptC